ncbi:MAG: cysteine desulfurase family protein [Bacteroidota bacterium]
MDLPIYLDYNATTPLDPRVLDTMLPYFKEKYGNAASATHSKGWVAAKAVDTAREVIAGSIGAHVQEIYFTSGATEGINACLKGVAELYEGKGNHIVTVRTEHKAVLDVCESLERKGKEITYLSVDADGLIDLNELESAVRGDTLMVCVMLANNETGVIQPMKVIADIVHEKGSLLMSDATQAIGKIPVDVNDLGIDLMVMSAHKFYGPKGVGAMYLRRKKPRVRIYPLIEGGGHERGVRSGTLNVPGIVGMGKALELCHESMQADIEEMRNLRDHFEHFLLQGIGIRRNGHEVHRLSHVSNLAFEGVDSQKLVEALRDLSVSTGSACTSAKMEPSHVLKAMGRPDNLAFGSVRFSLGRFTNTEEIEYASTYVKTTLEKLRLQAVR